MSVHRGVRLFHGGGALSQVGTSSRRGRSSQPDVVGAKNMACHKFYVKVTCWLKFPKKVMSNLI
jgi:hypothetical protein